VTRVAVEVLERVERLEQVQVRGGDAVEQHQRAERAEARDVFERRRSTSATAQQKSSSSRRCGRERQQAGEPEPPPNVQPDR
jgi:hypothetical protein